MKRIISLTLIIVMLAMTFQTMVFAEVQEHIFAATNYGHSGSESGTGMFIGCVGDSGTSNRAPFVSGVTGNKNVTVGSARVGVIEFAIDGTLDADSITSAVMNVYVNSVNGNLGSDWMLLAAYETENPNLTYSVGNMDSSSFKTINEDYSYDAAFWSNEKISKSSLGWKTIDVTRAVVNALVENEKNETIKVVLRLQVPAAGLNISVNDNTPYIVVATGEKVEGKVRITDNEGNLLFDEETFVSLEGNYKYTDIIESKIILGDNFYVYDENLSVTEITLTEGGENIISIVYQKCNADDFYSGNPLINEGATCWFADPRSVTFKHDDIYENGKLVLPASDKTIVGAIDDEGTVKAIQYDNLTGELVNVVIDTNFHNDDHNNPTFLELPDHRIMVFWSKHTAEEYWYYRVTKEPDDLTTLGDEKKVSVAGFGNYTYPSPFYMTDQPDSFFLCWRGVSWHPTIAKYSLPDENDNIVCEIQPTQMVKSIGARPYVKYESNGKDRIYFTFTTAHPDNNNPNWVYYAEIDINNFNLYNIENELLCEGENLPYGKTSSINTSSDYGSLTVDNPSDKRDWVWDVCKDDNGVPVILLTRISGNKAQHDYYYARWNPETKQWDKTYIADGGGWFHQNENNAEKCYSGGMCLDHSDPSVVYVSKPTEGFYGNVYEIWKLKMNGVTVESETQITKNSEFNNVRPFVAWGSDSEDLISLTWMNGIYYYWIGDDQFPTTIMTDALLPEFNYNYGLEKIELPEFVTADLILPTVTFDGLDITWETTDETVIDINGFVTSGDADKKVTLTAKTEFGEKDFAITVPARDVMENNLILNYEFESDDLYEKDGKFFLKDKSGNGNDAKVFGTYNVNGVLDLSDNTGDTASNGYATAPEDVLENARSYTFVARINAENLNSSPRIYDFGADTGNSLFLRANKLSAGVKYNGGTTVMLSPDRSLAINTEYFLTVTFDAKSQITTVYIDGEEVGTATNLTTEPYMISGDRNYIGRTQWWDTSVSSSNSDFCGTIDDFSLFNTALTKEEINKLYVKNDAELEIEISVEGDSLRVNAIKENIDEKAILIVAAYADDCLIKAVFMENGTALVPTADVIKVFCFESLENLKPICKNVEREGAE